MAGPKKKTPTAKDPKKTETDETETDEEGTDEDDLNDRINAIVTNHTKRLSRSFSKQLDEIKALLTAKTVDETEGDETEGDETEGDEKPKSKRSDAATRRLEKRVAAAEERARAAEEREKRQAEQAKSAEERSLVSTALTKAGVTNPALHEAALALLFAKQMITRDDTGAVRLKGKDKYQLEALLDVDGGVAQWLKAEGKAFLPPADAGGSGASPQLGTGSDAGTLSKSEYAKLDKVRQAEIELQRATMGLPPLGS